MDFLTNTHQGGGVVRRLRDMTDGTFAEVEVAVAGVVASDGLVIIPDSYAQTLAYDGSGNLTTVTVVADNGNTYVQTMTWTSGKLTGVSKWVKQ